MLNTHSCYSLRYGVLQPDSLADWLLASGYDRIALTDINNTSAALSFIRRVQQQGQTPVVGVDFRNGIDCCYVGIARSNEGFMELNAFLSRHLHDETDFPAVAPELRDCYIIYPWEKAPATLREHEYIGIAPHQLNRFKLHDTTAMPEKYVALAPMSFLSKQHYNTHRLLRAIDCNTLLSKLPPEQQTRKDEYFLSRELLQRRYEEFPELVSRAERLLKSCSIAFQFGDDAVPQNLATFTGSRESDYEKILELCHSNLPKRYAAVDDAIRERIVKELDVIRQKDYLSYFLIAWEIVSYAHANGYFYVGRGSGANSIIAYLLGITDVDPMELDLYFERFINLYRKNPPDFDIDFSWRDRDDVTTHIFETYPNAAMICTYNTFQYRATVRELGKVFGLPKSEIDGLSNEKPAFSETDELERLVLKYSRLIAGLPSHLSVHAGGIVISEKPVHWFSATFLSSKHYPVTQFSMLEAEDVGLYKFDILSQRGLGKIKDCLDIVRQNQPHNPPHDIRDVNRFKHDDNINRLLREAKALGCFYIESPGMRMLMLKLRTNSYLELVAASSIIRPGVAQSGMMREYILRHRVPERRSEIHPKMLELMPETYGVMVYQEDVIKVASQFAGLSLAESDILRRGMSGKFRMRDEFRHVRKLFFDNCIAKGYDTAMIQAVWSQIESFAGFAFSKGHSASYAVESYQCLYLKTYYPLEYMVAVINNFGGFYHSEIYVHEARKLGAAIGLPCINRSVSETTISGTKIILGFQHILGLEQKTIETIVRERENGAFTDFNDLIDRTFLPLEQLALLIRIGALRTFGIAKKNLMWKAHLSQTKARPVTAQPALFSSDRKAVEIPEFEEDPLEAAFEQLELLEFPLCSPFELLPEPLPEHPKAADMSRYIGKQVKTFGYLVHLKNTSTRTTNETMLFGTFLDADGELLDTVHFPDVVKRFRFSGRGIYELHGTVTTEFDFQTIEVHYLRKLPYRPDPRYYDE